MIDLGPKLFAQLNSGQMVGNQKPVLYGEGGMTAAQIASVEAQLGFRLPEDFAYLLQNIRDEGGVFFPWLKFDRKNYDEMMEFVWGGIEFDIDANDLWLYRWGERPRDLAEAFAIARRDFATWPKLVPVYGHRFLAVEPCVLGNPVFSIVQTDIVYYGSDLAHYLVNEFLDHDWEAHTQGARHIEIWSDLIDGRSDLLATGWGKD